MCIAYTRYQIPDTLLELLDTARQRRYQTGVARFAWSPDGIKVSTLRCFTVTVLSARYTPTKIFEAGKVIGKEEEEEDVRAM